MRRFLLLAALLGAVLLVGWRALRDDESPSVPPPAVEPTPRGDTGAASADGSTPIPTEVEFRTATRAGVSGGQLTTTLPGTPEQIRAMLTDFEHAAARRSFANRLEVLSHETNEVEAAVTLKGKLGVSPTIHVLYTTERAGDAITIRYQLTKKAFGVAAYSGEYVMEPLPGTPARSRYTSRIFLSSGISIAKIDPDDVESGQRTDAGELRAWMAQRQADAR